MIDYKKEFLDIINNSGVKILPSQNIIDDDESIAVALLLNYDPISSYNRDMYDDEQVYEKLNWSQHFKKYKSSLSFWKKAIEDDYIANLVLKDYFQKDFPEVTQLLLGNDDTIASLYQKTKNLDFLFLLKNQDMKAQLHKDFLLSNAYLCKTDDFLLYQADKDFVEKALNKKPDLYIYLSEQDKNNATYVKLALKRVDMMEHIPHHLQNNIAVFNYWINSNVNYIGMKNFKNFTHEQQILFLEQKPDFISTLLNENISKWQHIIIKLLKEDFLKTLSHIPSKIIQNNNFAQILLKDDFIFEEVKKEIISYSSVSQSPKNEKIYYLSTKSKALENISKDNLFFNILRIKLNKTKINKNDYDESIENTFKALQEKKITREQAMKIVVEFKNSCERDVIMNLPPTKNLFLHYESQRINEKISSLNVTENKSIIKRKI